jgi:hypothetical protein
MIRLVLVLVLVLSCDDEPTSTPPPPPKTATTSTSTAKQRKDCRDSCEQTKIVVGGNDDQLRACRARCDGESPAPPHEVPRSISRAPAVSRPPPIKPR